jgi:hypothetical protein
MEPASKTVSEESVVARSWATLAVDWEMLNRLLENENSFLGGSKAEAFGDRPSNRAEGYDGPS